MTGLLDLKSLETGHFFHCIIIVVHLGHGIIHPVCSFFFSQNWFLGGSCLDLSNCGTLENNVVRLYRGTRPQVTPSHVAWVVCVIIPTVGREMMPGKDQRYARGVKQGSLLAAARGRPNE